MSLYPYVGLWLVTQRPLMGLSCASDWSGCLGVPGWWLMSPAPSHYSSNASPVSGAAKPLIGQFSLYNDLWLVNTVPSPQLWCIGQKVWPTCSSSRPLQLCSISCSPAPRPLSPGKLHTLGIGFSNIHSEVFTETKIVSFLLENLLKSERLHFIS